VSEAPAAGFAAELPKVKVGCAAAAGAAGVLSVFAGAIELPPNVAEAPPKRGADGVEAPLPGALPGDVAGLPPNKEPAAPVPPNGLVLWPPNKGVDFGASAASAGFSDSPGFAPNNVVGCVAGAAAVASVGLFNVPKRLPVAGA